MAVTATAPVAVNAAAAVATAVAVCTSSGQSDVLLVSVPVCFLIT